jgi:hypothetical protein
MYETLAFLLPKDPSGMEAIALGMIARVMAVFLAAIAIAGALRRSSAAARHFVWASVLSGTFLLPLHAGVVPAWHWNILPRVAEV